MGKYPPRSIFPFPKKKQLTSNQNWGAKTGFFYAGTCLCCYIWAFFRLPEAKGRTYGELDILFERHVSAREFASTVVESLHVNDTESDFGEKKLPFSHLEQVDSKP